jgi:acyl carrier protein
MSASEVDGKFRRIIASVFHVDPVKVGDETRFIEDLHVKSIDRVELSAMTEDEFGVEVPISVAMKNKTVGDTVKYIKGELEKKSNRQ